ncbi:alpha/beta fold hydrolase [Haloechinothrix sp. LS1_15]|uniref:esterase/lipase family protein n=1 Tax=Haloechinothrix sp. LS1_15 TaxID=2652248 RepID=UPI002948A8F4|nr:alpha/beta fold hydrolase [Haloechinothrix sp. LS1_15]MDV6011452.1 alpha/beta fold hydrolase [Haloechinothrix sp. LS1_15]
MYRGSRTLLTLAASFAGTLVLAVGGASAVAESESRADTRSTAEEQSTSEGPETSSFVRAFLYSQVNWAVDPPGANDWDCEPPADRPRPVVLVHGTWENRYSNFAKMAPELERAGYCVFALDYGDDRGSLIGLHPALKGTGDIAGSARELGQFVDEVLDATEASQVDIVGHSQGGMMPRQYLRFEGGADPENPERNKVRNLVTLGATHNGTTLSGLATLAEWFGLLEPSELLLGTAAVHQVRGSDFLEELNAEGHTEPGVDYTVIATRYDQVTTPYESTFLEPGPGATVENITLQDGCHRDLSDHLSMSYSPRAIGYVKQALDPAAGAPPCEFHRPVG